MPEDLQAEVENNEQSTSKDTEKQQKLQVEKNDSANYSMNFALFGGLVGAGIGLLLNPEKTKNFFQNMNESELAKTAGKEFRKTAQSLLADQVQQSISQLASTNDGQPPDDSSSYEKLKNENKSLNERLDRIEGMLDELSGAKEN